MSNRDQKFISSRGDLLSFFVSYLLSLPKRLTKHFGFLRIISSLLVAAFLLQDLAYANPDLGKQTRPSWPNSVLPGIPASVAVIEDVWNSTVLRRESFV